MNILAMDLGKSNTVVCFYDSETGEHKFQRIRTSPKYIEALVRKMSPDRVVFEVCSSAGWVYDIVLGLGVEVQVANANTQAWRWHHRAYERQVHLRHLFWFRNRAEPALLWTRLLHYRLKSA
jgi:hypothetical protein